MITLERKPYQMIIVKMEPYPILSQIKQIVTFGIVIVYQIMLFWKKNWFSIFLTYHFVSGQTAFSSIGLLSSPQKVCDICSQIVYAQNLPSPGSTFTGKNLSYGLYHHKYPMQVSIYKRVCQLTYFSGKN